MAYLVNVIPFTPASVNVITFTSYDNKMVPAIASRGPCYPLDLL